MPIAASPNSSSATPPEVVPAVGDSDGSHMFVFTNEKAGMENVDKERANRIIHEMSKNSSFYKQAEQQDKKVDVKVRTPCSLQTRPRVGRKLHISGSGIETK